MRLQRLHQKIRKSNKLVINLFFSYHILVDDGKPAKYVPMHLRSGANKPTSASQSAPGASKESRRDDPNTIRISNLSEDTTEIDVRTLVNPFGAVSRVFVARDNDYNVCKGFAFVTFFERSRAEACIAKLNGRGYDNLILKVDFAR